VFPTRRCSSVVVRDGCGLAFELDIADWGRTYVSVRRDGLCRRSLLCQCFVLRGENQKKCRKRDWSQLTEIPNHVPLECLNGSCPVLKLKLRGSGLDDRMTNVPHQFQNANLYDAPSFLAHAADSAVPLLPLFSVILMAVPLNCTAVRESMVKRYWTDC